MYTTLKEVLSTGRDKPNCNFMGSDDSGESSDGVCSWVGIYTAADQ